MIFYFPDLALLKGALQRVKQPTQLLMRKSMIDVMCIWLANNEYVEISILVLDSPKIIFDINNVEIIL
jgi:hypothetical protein